MSKKWIALLTVACIALGAFVVFQQINADKQGPEINITPDAISVYRNDMNDSELLAGITATDDRDGDVSDTLRVESIYETDTSHVIITYTAKDDSNNITKIKCQFELDSDSSEPKEENTSSESDSKDNISEDTKLSDTVDETISETDEPEVSPTPAAKDDAQEEKEKQEAETDSLPAQSPRVYLTDYLVKVPVGTSVDLLSYVSEIKDDSDDVYELWRKIQITGSVNSAVPGTYKCTYYVIDSQNNISNNAVLTVIVE